MGCCFFKINFCHIHVEDVFFSYWTCFDTFKHISLTIYYQKCSVFCCSFCLPQQCPLWLLYQLQAQPHPTEHKQILLYCFVTNEYRMSISWNKDKWKHCTVMFMYTGHVYMTINMYLIHKITNHLLNFKDKFKLSK